MNENGYSDYPPCWDEKCIKWDDSCDYNPEAVATCSEKKKRLKALLVEEGRKRGRDYGLLADIFGSKQK